MTTPTQNEAVELTNALVAELREALKEGEPFLTALTPKVALEKVIAILSAQANDAKALEDAKRLDWLESTQNSAYTVYDVRRKYRTDGSHGHDDISTFAGWSVGSTKDCHDTLRTAIDAARQGMQTGGGE